MRDLWEAAIFGTEYRCSIYVRVAAVPSLSYRVAPYEHMFHFGPLAANTTLVVSSFSVFGGPNDPECSGLRWRCTGRGRTREMRDPKLECVFFCSAHLMWRDAAGRDRSTPSEAAGSVAAFLSFSLSFVFIAVLLNNVLWLLVCMPGHTRRVGLAASLSSNYVSICSRLLSSLLFFWCCFHRAHKMIRCRQVFL